MPALLDGPFPAAVRELLAARVQRGRLVPTRLLAWLRARTQNRAPTTPAKAGALASQPEEVLACTGEFLDQRSAMRVSATCRALALASRRRADVHFTQPDHMRRLQAFAAARARGTHGPVFLPFLRDARRLIVDCEQVEPAPYAHAGGWTSALKKLERVHVRCPRVLRRLPPQPGLKALHVEYKRGGVPAVDLARLVPAPEKLVTLGGIFVWRAPLHAWWRRLTRLQELHVSRVCMPHDGGDGPSLRECCPSLRRLVLGPAVDAHNLLWASVGSAVVATLAEARPTPFALHFPSGVPHLLRGHLPHVPLRAVVVGYACDNLHRWLRALRVLGEVAVRSWREDPAYPSQAVPTLAPAVVAWAAEAGAQWCTLRDVTLSPAGLGVVHSYPVGTPQLEHLTVHVNGPALVSAELLQFLHPCASCAHATTVMFHADQGGNLPLRVGLALGVGFTVTEEHSPDARRLECKVNWGARVG